LCIGDTLRLNILDSNATYVWNNGSVYSYLDIFSAGTYSVQITDKCGTSTVTKTISAISCCTPYIPNLLTNNNDGLNETLFISCIEDGQWKLEIFNRWGERIFQSDDYHNELNSQRLEEGIYYYDLSKKGNPNYKGWLQVMK
jgi:gliding motility-associated-like protein